MSSNRISTPCEAVITRQERPVGPMLMPTTNAESFVDEFNRTYRSIGLTVSLNEAGRTIFHPRTESIRQHHAAVQPTSPAPSSAPTGSAAAIPAAVKLPPLGDISLPALNRLANGLS